MSRKMKDFNRGLCLGNVIRGLCSKDDMKVIRCILGNIPENVPAVLRYLSCDNIPTPSKECMLGVWIVLK